MASEFWSKAQYILFVLHRPRKIISIQRKTGFSRQTIRKLVKVMEELNLVKTKKSGKYLIVETTEQGKEVRKTLLDLYNSLEKEENTTD